MNTGPSLVYIDLIYTQRPDDYTGPRWQPWSVMVRSGDNHHVLFRSSERYTNEEDAVRAAEIAFGMNSNVWLRFPGRRDVDNKPIRMAMG